MLQDRPQSSESSGTARLGAEMRAARERLGWGVPELAASLRIRPQYLDAIEDGRVADLPGTTYALGFIRAYGNALGLPGPEYAARFRAEGGPANKRPELTFPVPVPQRGVPAGALVLLGMLVVAAAYGGWYYYSADQRTPSHVVAALPSILPSVAPPSQLAPAAAGVTAGRAPVTPTAGPAPAALTPAPQAAPAGVAGPGSAPAAAPAAVGGAAASVPTPAPTPSVPTPSVPTPPAVQPAMAGIVVKATAESWVMVRDAGKVLLNRTMHAGDTWPLPAAAASATLTTGNAGGTVVMVDGADMPSLGASGAVRRDVALDPAGLRSGHPAAAPSAGKASPSATDRLNDAELRRSHAGVTGPD